MNRDLWAKLRIGPIVAALLLLGAIELAIQSEVRSLLHPAALLVAGIAWALLAYSAAGSRRANRQLQSEVLERRQIEEKLRATAESLSRRSRNQTGRSIVRTS